MELKEAHWADISLSAFRDNVRRAKISLAGDAQLMIAVKSDAYGHGGPRLALAALEAGADALAVLDIDYGVAIREVAPDVPLLCWLHSPSSDFGRAATASLDLGISANWQLELLRDQAPKSATRVHLKIDTGLHRNGALPEQWLDLVHVAQELEAEGHIRVVGIWSHLADTSLEEDLASLTKLHDAVAIATDAGLRPEVVHLAASAAAADLPETRLDMVRVGIIAYGVSPFDDRSAKDLGFQPVMSVHARVISRDAHSATVGMGYGDGLLPPSSGEGWLVHQGIRYSISAVEADHLVITSSDGQPLPEVGDEVTLWGKPDEGSPLAEDWAAWAGTIGDEIVASLGAQVPRRFIDETGDAR